MNKKPEIVRFVTDKETNDALKVITRKLGRGNQSDGIRRALIETAERINQRETVKMTVPEDASLEQPCAEASK